MGGKLQPYADLIVELKDKQNLTFEEIRERLAQDGMIAARSTVQETYREAIREPVSLTTVESATQDTDYLDHIRFAHRDQLKTILETPHEVEEFNTPNNTTDGVSKLLLLSDIHHGKHTVDSQENLTYSTEIARQRITEIGDKVLRSISGETRPIDELVIAMVGDIVNNEIIYDGQQFDIDTPLLKQVRNAVRDIWECIISRVLDVGVAVRVEGVRGNHGRTGAKGSSKETNWDNVVYNSLKIMATMTTEEEERASIQVDYSTGASRLFKVRNWLLYMRHIGPVQVETRAMSDKIGGWYKAKHFDTMLYAHNHHCGLFEWKGVPVMMNGCVCGPDDYAEELATDGVPSQWLIDVTDESVAQKAERLVLT